ncbi:MAG: 7-cyano-7-deazaguanine synthase QueC [Terriglobales bacterium]
MANTSKTRAVVLLSGGMDSCVCAAIAARDYDPAALHVMYGQRTEERERRSFEGICDALGIRRRLVVRNDALRQIGGSALTDAAINVPVADDEFAGRGSDSREPKAESRVPITYVPFRNAHFLSAAVSWAEVLGAERILIGAVEQDSSGYPDCRPEYYRAFNEVIRTGTAKGDITIETPLIGMRKSEIVTLGLELGAPFNLTWSCYSGDKEACGRCESCVLRLRAFAAAGARDPISYAEGVRSQ